MSFPLESYAWTKYGLTYDSTRHNPSWGSTHALVPTPQVLSSNEVAIYSSFVDQEFRGRIGRVDIGFHSGHPEVINVNHEPTMNIGVEGSFSQYGVGMGTFGLTKKTVISISLHLIDLKALNSKPLQVRQSLMLRARNIYRLVIFPNLVRN